LAYSDNTNSEPRSAERFAPSEGRPEGERGGERRESQGQGGYRQRRDNRRPGRICQFCAENVVAIDYKEVSLLRQYVNERGRIHARRKTGTCAKHQRILSRAIKRARQMALLPYTAQHVRPGA
jgi:small subunit ribosomal protein S18